MWKKIQEAQKQINEGSSFFGQKTDEVIGGQTANVPLSGDDGGSSAGGQKENKAITSQPADNVGILPGDNSSTTPNIQSGPSKLPDWMSQWISFPDFARKVFNNKSIFAEHEVRYLKRNTEDLSGRKEKVEKRVEEAAKKMNEQIYEEMMKKVRNRKNEWSRKTLIGEDSEVRPMTDDRQAYGMFEENRTGGMFSESRKMNRQIAEAFDDE